MAAKRRGGHDHLTFQVEPGKWYRVRSPRTEICCDCGLAHRAERKLEDGILFERVHVDRRETRKQRREQGITMTRKGGPNDRRE